MQQQAQQVVHQEDDKCFSGAEQASFLYWMLVE
jgi:hypothetical protein